MISRVLLVAAWLAAGGASAAETAPSGAPPPGYVFAPAPADTWGKQVTEAAGLAYTDAKGWYRLTYGTDGKMFDDGKSTSFGVTTDQGAELQFNFVRAPFNPPVTDISFDQIQAAQPRQFDPRSDMEKQLADQTVKSRHILMLAPATTVTATVKPVRLAVWVMAQPDNSVLWLGVAAGNKGFLVINAAGPNVQAIEGFLKSHLQIAEGFVF